MEAPFAFAMSRLIFWARGERVSLRAFIRKAEERA